MRINGLRMLASLKAMSVSSASSSLSSTSKMLCPEVMSGPSCLILEGEGEGGARVDLGRSGEASPVAGDDSLNRREANPRPFELRRPMQALERRKQLVSVGHVEARAIVTHEERGPSGAGLQTK